MLSYKRLYVYFFYFLHNRVSSVLFERFCRKLFSSLRLLYFFFEISIKAKTFSNRGNVVNFRGLNFFSSDLRQWSECYGTNTKCEEESSRTSIIDLNECQSKAQSAGHKYFQFCAEKKQCQKLNIFAPFFFLSKFLALCPLHIFWTNLVKMCFFFVALFLFTHQNLTHYFFFLQRPGEFFFTPPPLPYFCSKIFRKIPLWVEKK